MFKLKSTSQYKFNTFNTYKKIMHLKNNYKLTTIENDQKIFKHFK